MLSMMATLRGAMFLMGAAVYLVGADMSSSPGNDVTTPGKNSAVMPCPAVCRCSSDGLSVDCSGRQLADRDVNNIILQLDPAVGVLDLRANQITRIRSRAFQGLSNLTVLLLDNNAISDIEPEAFYSLTNIRTLSLRLNQIRRLRSNSMSYLSASAAAAAAAATGEGGVTTAGGKPTVVGSIDLTGNDLVTVEKHAFAWIKQLQILLGRSRAALNVDQYAFYGARFIKLVVEQVPSLTLQPRLFTNTEHVELVEIKQTSIDYLDSFVFEGLKNVDRIQFSDVVINSIRSFAFSGMHFTRGTNSDKSDAEWRTPEVQVQGQAKSRQYRGRKLRPSRSVIGGGVINMTSCNIKLLLVDAFRDLNVANIVITSSELGVIEGNAFQGILGLQSLYVTNNKFTSRRLTQDSFSSLRGLNQLHFIDNDFSVIEPFAFREVNDIKHFYIRFRSEDVTLMTESFAQVSDVEFLQLSGMLTSPIQYGRHRATLNVDASAFRNLVGIEFMRIEYFRWPVMKQNSFAGLSRIANLTIANCDVTRLEKGTFGDSSSYLGAVERFDISIGNQLNCHCTAGTMSREFELRFGEYSAYCRVEMASEDRFSYVELQQMATVQDPACKSLTSRASTRPFSSLLLVVTALTVCFSFLLFAYSR